MFLDLVDFERSKVHCPAAELTNADDKRVPVTRVAACNKNAFMITAAVEACWQTTRLRFTKQHEFKFLLTVCKERRSQSEEAAGGEGEPQSASPQEADMSMFARLPVSWHAPEEDGAGDDDVDPHAKTVNNVLGRDEVLRVHTEGARVALPVLGTEHLRALGCTLVHPGGEFVLETPCPIYQTIMDMGEDYLEARLILQRTFVD